MEFQLIYIDLSSLCDRFRSSDNYVLGPYHVVGEVKSRVERVSSTLQYVLGCCWTHSIIDHLYDNSSVV